MSLANLAKLNGGYINIPMINGETINLENERDVFDIATQKLSDFKNASNFAKYISVFHKLIPYYKTFERLSFIYTDGMVTGRTNFMLFRVINDSKGDQYYLLNSYDMIDGGEYKYFVINDSFKITEIVDKKKRPMHYWGKKLAIIPDIFKYNELVELFYNFKNIGTILTTFNDINMIFIPNASDPEHIKSFKTNVRKIIDNIISDFNNIIEYLFINVNGTMLPRKSGNILNIFFYTGNLNFTYNILLNNNIYDMVENQEFLQCNVSQSYSIKASGKGREISLDNLLGEIKRQITESRPDPSLEQVINMIQGIKTNEENNKYKLVIIYLIKVLHSNMMIHNCRDIYNFLLINDIITNFEKAYNSQQDDAIRIGKINERIKELNRWVSNPSNEAKVIFYLIIDIIKCKLIFDKVTQKNPDIVIYAINTYMASMIQQTNIPFNINIFSHHVKGRLYKLPQNPTKIDIMNNDNMKLFQRKFRSIAYKLEHVCDPSNTTNCRPDCGETTILNILIYLLLDENLVIRADWLPDNSQEFLRRLFNTYNSIDSIDIKEIRRDQFNRHLQGIEFVYQGMDGYNNQGYRYYAYQTPTSANERFHLSTNSSEVALGRKVYDDMGNTIEEEIKYTGWELRPGYITIVRILNHILGYSNGKGPEESLNENFLMKNLNKDSLKEILLTIKNPKINEILSNYRFTGELYDPTTKVSFGELIDIIFDYNHAELPEIKDDVSNYQIIGTAQQKSKSDKKKYVYNPKRYYLLSNIEHARFNSLHYLDYSDLITVMLTPKNRITNWFKNLINEFINNRNKLDFTKYIREPKFNYICELIKIYENKFEIINLNSKLTKDTLTWFHNKFYGHYFIPIKRSSSYLVSLMYAFKDDKTLYNNMIWLLIKYDRNVFTRNYLNNDTFGNILLKSGYVEIFDDLKVQNELKISKGVQKNTAFHIVYSMFDNMNRDHLRDVPFDIIGKTLCHFDRTYNILEYNNKNILGAYPIEPLLFAREKYDNRFVIDTINKMNVTTLFKIICNNWSKFNKSEYPNTESIIEILPKLLEGYDDLRENIYTLFIIASINKGDDHLFDSIQEINDKLEYIVNNIESQDTAFKIAKFTANNTETKDLSKMIHKYRANIITHDIFNGVKNHTKRDALIFPYIYNNNILESPYFYDYIDQRSSAIIHNFSRLRDFNGDTIYHYFAMYATYNYGNNIISDKISRLYNLIVESNIGAIINGSGWSVIDILSIIPINYNMLGASSELSIQFLENHFAFLLNYYKNNGFKPTDKVILYRHIISKYFFAFSGANRLLHLINEYIKNKPGIDDYFITLLNTDLYLYKYCDRLTSSELIYYITTRRGRIERRGSRLNTGNRIPFRRDYEYIIANKFNDMVSYDDSVKPLQPFPKEIWYKLLPFNSPVSEFTIPIKTKLKEYGEPMGPQPPKEEMTDEEFYAQYEEPQDDFEYNYDYEIDDEFE